MPTLRPKHPFLKALFAVGSAIWYLFLWRRGKKREVVTVVVDAEGKVIDEKTSV